MKIINISLITLLLWCKVAFASQTQNLELVFFFMSNCGYCHKLAPELLNVARNNNINIKSVSADGYGIKGFERAVTDINLINQFEVHSYPTVYLLNKKTMDAYPITVGYIDIQTLNNRVAQSIAYISKSAKND